MKRIACFLLALSTLATQLVNAQTCPNSATYTNQSGTFDLTAGKTIVLNNGKSYQITIQNDFSSTSSICVLNGSTLYLSFQNANNMGKGGFIHVDKTSGFIINSSVNNFPLTINNSGSTIQQGFISFADGAIIINSGSYNVSGGLTLNTGTVAIANTGAFTFNSLSSFNTGNFSLTNSATGTINFNCGLTFSSFNITNLGLIDILGGVTLQNSSVITNNGTMKMHSDLNFSGATFNNNGVAYVSGSVMVNSYNTFTNTCTAKISGALTNNGTVSNSGNVLINGSFTNQNTFTNNANGFVQFATFSNNGNISGAGNFYCYGVSINQAPFNGTSATNKINFYEPSLAHSNRYFDIQNTQPTNITKNAISPNTATTFTSCADVTAPVITTQPSTQMLCDNFVTSATFSVTATSNNTPTYQWYKNGTTISGATSSSYTATGLTFADTSAAFTVGVTNGAGTTISNAAFLKYIILSQPTPLTQYLATGNSASFTIKTSGATAWQWQRNGASITGANVNTYSLSAVNYADSGNYTVLVTYNGGVCTSNAAVLKTSVVLYSAAKGNLTDPKTWGINIDGSGSNPVDFTRTEHTFVVANRATAATGSNLTIAGKLDLANATLTLTAGTTLCVGRLIRSLPTGALAGSSSSSLTIAGILPATSVYAGASDLYFTATSDTLQNLIISNHAVTLHTALVIAAGSTPNILQVNGGSFNTSDSLTLQSNINGTASIAKSLGAITGKVTIEKFIHARRAWRLMGAPITATNAPSINAAWQEGATSSTANPHPGYGTHITYGAVSDGFDQNPQKTFSMKVYNSTTQSWSGVPATRITPITNYSVYFIFIRGNRSYNIITTTASTTPMTTNLRVTGNVNQGTQPAKAVAATGLTLMMNPYASPVNFAKIVSASSNLKTRYRVWDPTLAGTNGVGAWVTVDGFTGNYKSTPPSAYVANVLEAGQGFFVESSDGKTAGSLSFTEDVKDQTVSTTSADRIDSTTDTSLEVNLKLFNPDSTTAITDGILFNFNSAFSDSVNNSDAAKLGNISENLGIKEGNSLLTIDDRTLPAAGDSLRLSLSNTKNASYQFEIVPSSLTNVKFSLYDKYLNSFSTISSSDTTHITFNVNTSVAASKAADRFVIVMQKVKISSTVLPVLFTSVKASAQEKTINVEWKVGNETGILYYEVQKSTNATTFNAIGNVVAIGASSYNFTDATPAQGTNYYRIKSVSKPGDVHYTNIVTAQLQTASATGISSVSVYPNPLTGPSFTLTLSNMVAGTYTIAVVNQNGATQFSQPITHSGGTASQTITLNNSLAAGVYYIKIASATGTTNMVKVEAR